MKRSLMKRLPGLALVALVGLSPVQTAQACAFHGYTPNPTLVDQLLTTEQAVIARPNAAGQYTVVDALLGPNVGDVPVTVSAAIRSQLARAPDATVLLARDGAYGPWMEIAVLDPQFRRVVETVMQNQTAWQLGQESSRIKLFAALANDPNPNIQRLALQELDRLPYAILKDVRVPSIRDLLKDIEAGKTDERPIRILLAGLSNDRRFGPALADALHQAVLADKAYLGAYVTALIELQGKPAVEAIITHYLLNGSVPRSVQEKLLDALALQYKTARGATRRTIARDVTALVRKKPEMAEIVTAQFGPQVSGRLLR